MPTFGTRVPQNFRRTVGCTRLIERATNADRGMRKRFPQQAGRLTATFNAAAGSAVLASAAPFPGFAPGDTLITTGSNLNNGPRIVDSVNAGAFTIFFEKWQGGVKDEVVGSNVVEIRTP